MRITEINIRKENLSITRPYTIAFKTIDSVENGIIEIIADNGLRGYGAFNPSYEVVGEKLEDAMGVLTPGNIEWLIGKDTNEIDVLCEAVQKQFAASVTARTGMEMALYDLFCQGINKPLAVYLGQKIKSMPTSITIGIKNVEETIEEAKEYIGKKFKILKIKLGISLEEDIERIIKLREVFGYTVDIIVDANQGYDEQGLMEFYRRTGSLNILLIEQPLRRGNEKIMTTLPAYIKKLVAADESLINPRDAESLSAPPKACGYFNIKLMKCGGITQALNIAGTALNNDIGLMWGCNDESLISITAALHTAFACGNTKFIDLDGSLDLARDVMAGGFILKDGIMSVGDKAGLGLIPF